MRIVLLTEFFFCFVNIRRVDPAYERGAWDFVQAVSASKGDIQLIICPCTDCRNVDRHSASDIVDHLVRRGMDEVYKRRKDWFHHEEVDSVAEGGMKVNQWNEEIVGLFRAAGNLDEELATT